MTRGKTVVVCGVLSALALALSWMERLLPLGLLVPLPGVKLGIANIVTMFALYFWGAAPAFAILTVRCLLSAFLGGGVTALAFSLTGGLLALGVMWLLKRFRCFSLLGVSMAGAAAHNLGQMAACVLLLGSVAPLSYLSVLLPAALVTGLATGGLSIPLFGRLEAALGRFDK